MHVLLRVASGAGITLALAACVAPTDAVPVRAIEMTATVIATAATPKSPAPTPPPPHVTIALVGDLMIARDVVDLMKTQGGAYPFERVRGLLAGTDLLVGNLEGTFTSGGVALPKRYTFRAPPALAPALVSTGFSAVTLGNNHAYDFGAEGLRDTLEALRAAGIPSAGAGLDEPAARAPAVLRAPGATVALLSYSAVPDSWFASAQRAGVARAGTQSIRADVEAARATADFVVVVLHAGIEYQRQPTVLQQELAHAAIEAGASIVVGHHPHVLQRAERYQDGIVVYSLGNFVFDLDRDDRATLGSAPFETAVAVFTLEAGAAPRLEVRPAYIDPDENRPRPPTADEAARVLAVLAPAP